MVSYFQNLTCSIKVHPDQLVLDPSLIVHLEGLLEAVGEVLVHGEDSELLIHGQLLVEDELARVAVWKLLGGHEPLPSTGGYRARESARVEHKGQESRLVKE